MASSAMRSSWLLLPLTRAPGANPDTQILVQAHNFLNTSQDAQTQVLTPKIQVQTPKGKSTKPHTTCTFYLQDRTSKMQVWTPKIRVLTPPNKSRHPRTSPGTNNTSSDAQRTSRKTSPDTQNANPGTQIQVQASKYKSSPPKCNSRHPKYKF